MTNENQKRQKEEESKQKRLLKESRQKAKEAEKENKIRQKAKENAKRLAEKNSTDLPPATASEKAPDNERAADVKPAGDEISTRGQVESDTRSPRKLGRGAKEKARPQKLSRLFARRRKMAGKIRKGRKSIETFRHAGGGNNICEGKGEKSGRKHNHSQNGRKNPQTKLQQARLTAAVVR